MLGSKKQILILNKNILKKFNYYRYNTIFFIYNFVTFLVHPFQRKFIVLYSAQLQLNRLPFRILPTTIKTVLIYFVDIDSWIWFFKRIKHNNNLYIIREKQYPFLHRLWCIFFRNRAIYYSELNIKRCVSSKISNFFYKTRRVTKEAKKPSSRRYKLIIYFYINKLVFSQYPYFYWTYNYAYNAYNYYNSKYNYYNSKYNTSTNSEHIRTQIFFFFVNEYYKFKFTKKTFIKFDFYTFKGMRKTFLNFDKIKQYNHIFKKTKRKDNILSKLEDRLTLFDKTFIKSYYKLNNAININFKVYLNVIILNSTLRFSAISGLNISNFLHMFKITWFNKLHNSTHSFIKNNIILFLRSTKHFNKGRYSRNRQLYRTGVYWCIWLNIIIVYSLHFYFYRIVYSFGYFWLPIGFIILSFFSSRLYKYRYYNVTQIIIEFKEFINFLFFIFLKIKVVYSALLTIKLKQLINLYENYLFLLYIFISSKFRRFFAFFKKII